MIDAIIIRFFADNPDRLRTSYTLLDKKMFTRSAAVLLEAMFEWVESHDAVSIEGIVASLMLKGIPANQFQEIKAVAEQAMQIDEVDEEWHELAEQLSAREAAYRIADIADRVVSGDAQISDIRAVLEKHDKLTEDVSMVNSALLDCSPEQVYHDTYQRDGMPWSLDFINRNIGSLQKGTFTILGARPDSGKTTVLMNEAACLIKAGVKVLWLNNEERDKKVYLRLVQSTLGITRQEIDEDTQVLHKFDQYKDQLAVANIRRMRPQDVELLVDDVQPDVIIFDQLYKMRGFNARDSEPQRIHSLFIWARELAAEKDAAVITAHLADAEAAGKAFPEMHMLYMGKTGPQAEADTIIMMGREFDDPSGFHRGLTIVKSKEIQPGCDPVMRTYIEIDPFRVSVKELQE